MSDAGLHVSGKSEKVFVDLVSYPVGLYRELANSLGFVLY